jgi:hypothetical protein
VLRAEFGTTANAVAPGGRHSRVSCWPPPASKKSMCRPWYPVVRLTVPSTEVTPCSPSLLTTVAPSISSREPSSLVSRNVYAPAVVMLTLPITSVWKLFSSPKSAAVLQLTVGMSLSTLGVWPGLRVQIRSRAVCRSKVRSVTPGCCGGTAAAAGTACSRLVSNAAPTSRDIRGRVNIDILIERSPQTPGRSGSRVDDHRCLGTLGSFCTEVHNFG